MQSQEPKNPNLAVHYEYDVNNKYAGKSLPDEVFNPIFEKVKQYAIWLLCKLDPSHSELYQ